MAVFFLPRCAIMVLLGMHRSRVASMSPRKLAILSKSPSSDGVAVLMKVAFYTGAAGFVSPLVLAILSKRQVKRREGREGRLFHFSHCPPRPTGASAHTCRFSGVSGLLCSRRSKWSSVRKNSDVRPGSFQGRVDVAEATARDAPAQIPHCTNLLIERRFVRRVAKRTRPARSGCLLRHRGTLLALNIWHRPRKAVNRELHALNGNLSSSASAPILPVQGSDSARPTFRTRISRKRTLDMFLAPEVAARTCEERYSGRQDAFDELHGAGTLKGLLYKEVSLLLVELGPVEVCRDIGENAPCPFYP